ncbi:hypothetical protein GGE65_007901 [Skermanella aerolata]|uniref:right-handed parallel beta-helix repeat-containing protein n=1 Tax=Skermanella aerolata TaxID=393310 RepID=UPI003D24E041
MPTTYHVDPNGSDDAAGTAPEDAWRSVGRVGSFDFSPGDQVLFKRGGLWRERLTIPSDGIVIDAYGADGDPPLLSAADIVTGWRPIPPAFVANHAGDPGNQVLHNGKRLRKVAVRRQLKPGTFFWDRDSSLIHVMLPDGADPRSGVMEVSARDHAGLLVRRKDVQIRNIRFHHAREFNLYLTGGCERVTVDACDFRLSDGSGFVATCWGPIQGDVTVAQPDIAVLNCTAAFNHGIGIIGGNNCHRMLISHCVAHHNATLADGEEYSANIRIISDFVEGTMEMALNRPARCVIEHCVSYAAGRDETGEIVVTGERGHGIWLDTVGANSEIRYCVSHDNAKAGIYYEWGGPRCFGRVHHNVSYRNETGVLLSRRTTGCVVDHNTCWGNVHNLTITGEHGGERSAYGFHDNVVCDNIGLAPSPGGTNFRAFHGAENLGNGSGNKYFRNCWGVEGRGFVEWGAGRRLDRYVALESAYGSKMFNIETDPQLVDPPADFSLKPSSPCVGAAFPPNSPNPAAGLEARTGDNIGAL